MHLKRRHSRCQLLTALSAAFAGLLFTGIAAQSLAQDSDATSATTTVTKTTTITTSSENSGSVDAAIRAAAKSYEEAFARADAAALAAMWVENGSYVDSAGITCNGRAEIEKFFSDYFKQTDAKKNLEIKIDSIRALGDNAAIEKGTSLIKDENGKVVSSAPYTVVHVNNNGKWEMATVDEGRAQYYDNPLDKLRWMSGEWSAKGSEGEASLSTRWMADHRFLVAKFQVRTKGGESHEDLQVIGVDPRRRSIVSWIFDSQGGYGRGFWTTDGKRWSVDMVRTTPDGVRLEAKNVLELQGSDAFTWRSTGRKLNGLAIPDSDTITVNRIHL